MRSLLCLATISRLPIGCAISEAVPFCIGGCEIMPKAASNEIIPPYSVDWKSKLSDRIFPGDNVLHFTDHSLDLRPKIMTSVTSTWTPRASHNVALTIEDPTTKGKLKYRPESYNKIPL